jgi:ATP-binding cassette subfamily A (ABC1) protein 3
MDHLPHRNMLIYPCFLGRIFVNTGNNDAEIYALPLQHAVDAAIASADGSSIPLPQQFSYT